jgi:hypothetical protein
MSSVSSSSRSLTTLGSAEVSLYHTARRRCRRRMVKVSSEAAVGNPCVHVPVRLSRGMLPRIYSAFVVAATLVPITQLLHPIL